MCSPESDGEAAAPQKQPVEEDEEDQPRSRAARGVITYRDARFLPAPPYDCSERLLLRELYSLAEGDGEAAAPQEQPSEEEEEDQPRSRRRRRRAKPSAASSEQLKERVAVAGGHQAGGQTLDILLPCNRAYQSKVLPLARP